MALNAGENTKTPYQVCWPLIRNEYRKRAFNLFKSGNCDQAILYDSKSISCGFVGKYLNSMNIDNQSIDATVRLQQKSGNSLIDFLSGCMSELEISETNEPTTKSDIDIIIGNVGATELYDKCAKLPSQWNVIQLNQLYDGYNGYFTKKDAYTTDGLISLTLHRYNLEQKRNNRSLGLVFELNELNPKSILSTAYEINQVLYKDYSSAMSTPSYKDFIINLTQLQSKLIADMKLWLGPWITLFSGKIKGKHGEDFEAKIFDQVEKLCQKFDHFSDDQLVLLSLVARRLDLLDSETIQQAARDISQNHKEYTSIKDFLVQLKCKTTFTDFTYYPTILVIDEILDPMPWEMILPLQEFTRVPSIYILIDLYEKFKSRIDDGYFNVNLKNGFAVINPDNDEKLGDMSKRMAQFYDQYLPKWERIDQVMPNVDQLTNGIKNNDLFVYSGHGSSLQFVDGMEFENIKQCAIMLLFGCESIAMKPRGSICEAMSSSYIVFRSGSPGMLGALTIVTDIWIDLISILLLTQWILPKNVKHPTIDVCKDEHTKERVAKILQKVNGKRDPSLLALLADIRNESDISIRMRSAMAYRGLPPYRS